MNKEALGSDDLLEDGPDHLTEDKAVDSHGGAVRFGISRGEHRIPLFFLGLAAYRAWIEIVFVGSFVDFPIKEFAGHDAFDLAMIAFLLLCAAASKTIAPFFNKKWVYGLTVVALLTSTACAFVSLFMPSLAGMLAWPAAITGGLGVALIILLWSELYGCLNPIRVALYYSASIIGAALIVYLCCGLLTPWLFVVSLGLPILSLVCVSKGFNSLPESELPTKAAPKFSFPWKLVLLMAIYAFAYGLKEVEVYSTSQFGPHAAFGTLVVAIVIFVGVYARGGKFDFALIYRVALPLMVGAFLIVPSLGLLNEAVSGFCLTASYTSFSILIMIIFANMCYRYGVSAIWLFGLERGVRALFDLFGRQTAGLMDSYGLSNGETGLVITMVTVLLVVAMTMILLSERELSSKWGISFLGGGASAEDEAIIKKEELANRCHEVSKEYGLSQREEEVLLLLAQRKTVGTIERELFIANGTAKTHIRHIYKKLDVHSRDDLVELLGLYS